MITPERFQLNFQYLQILIPTKPTEYTEEYPKNIQDSFKFYLRQSSVNLLQSATMAYNEDEWPLPLWFDPNRIRIGFINRLNYNKSQFTKEKKRPLLDWFPPYDRVFKHIGKIPNNTPVWNYLLFPFFNKVFFKQDFSEGVVTAFDCNLKYIERILNANINLLDKKDILDDVFKTYRNGFYIASLTTVFPLLDHIARQFLKVSRLTKDVKQICKLFESCGYDSSNTEHLMYHTALVHMMGKRFEENNPIIDWEEEVKKVKKTNLGMIGPLLSSFLRFANIYYSYYKDETDHTNALNRHGILHGSLSSFGSKVNAVKLITFLYLFLELEPVFEVLLNED